MVEGQRHGPTGALAGRRQAGARSAPGSTGTSVLGGALVHQAGSDGPRGAGCSRRSRPQAVIGHATATSEACAFRTSPPA